MAHPSPLVLIEGSVTGTELFQLSLEAPVIAGMDSIFHSVKLIWVSVWSL